MPSTHKKVVVRKMDRDSINGYVATGAFITEGKFEMLNTAGNVIMIDIREVKGIYFVRDFGDPEPSLGRPSPAVRERRACGFDFAFVTTRLSKG